jgi:formylglycine-generating enzyme required for sulfatase activity
MAGNVHEWALTAASQGGRHRVVLGGGFEVPPESQYHCSQVENARDERYRDFAIGVRCAADLVPPLAKEPP